MLPSGSGPPTQASSHFSGSFFSSRKDTAEMQGRPWTHHPNPSQRPWDTVNILETWRPRALPGSSFLWNRQLTLTSIAKLPAHLVYKVLYLWRSWKTGDAFRLSEWIKAQAPNLAHPTNIQVQVFLHRLKTLFHKLFSYAFPVPKHYQSRSRVKIIHAFHKRHLFIKHGASTELDPWQYKGERRNTRSPHTKWVLGNNSPALYKYLLKTLSRDYHLTSCTNEERIRLREVRWFI